MRVLFVYLPGKERKTEIRKKGMLLAATRGQKEIIPIFAS